MVIFRKQYKHFAENGGIMMKIIRKGYSYRIDCGRVNEG